MKSFRATLVLGLAMSLMTNAIAKQLTIGSSAPKLDVSAWVKGTPVKTFKRGQVYVVEFWATWCGPCKDSILHITQMAKKYGPKANFIGVSIWEKGEDIPGKAKKFVEDMGAKMDYNVALDNGNAMAETWMAAAGQDGIPTAFIVNQEGQIAWLGHPLEGMDKVLDKVIEGKYDVKAAKDKHDALMEYQTRMAAAMEKGRSEMFAGSKLYESGKTAEAEATWAKVEKDYPRLQTEIMWTKMVTYVGHNRPFRARTLAKTMIRSGDAHKLEVAAQFALHIVERNPSPSDKQLATNIADEISKLTLSDSGVCHMIAEVAALCGNWTTAIERVSRGIALLEKDKFAHKDRKKFMSDELARYNKMNGQS